MCGVQARSIDVRRAIEGEPMTKYLWPLDMWVKVAQIVTALLTPAIAVWIGILSSRIQHQQSTIQKQQANTSHLQFRLALMERRMKVFNATQEFIALVLREARIETLEPLFTLLRETRESQFLFGSEISGYIDELYKKGARLHAIAAASRPRDIIRPEDIPVAYEINVWFSGQIDIAREKFLKYLDFREP